MRALTRAAAPLLPFLALPFLVSMLHAVARADDTPDADTPLIDWHIRNSRFSLDVGWPEGVTYELGRRQPLATEYTLLKPFEQIVLTGQLKFRLDIDDANFVTPASLGDFESGLIVRRARLEADGQFLLGVTTDYDFEMSIEGNRVFLNQFYVAWNPNRFGVATITLGHTTPPMGLENLESSRTYAFMEMGSPSMALAPGYRSGIILNGAHVPWNLAWQAGFFTSGQRQATGDASQTVAQGISRFAWHAGHPDGDQLVHLGLSMSAAFSAQSNIKYQSRPESFKAPFVANTGSIDASSATQYGLEAAWSRGARLIQAELLQSFVADDDHGDDVFWGAYLFTSWFLTGEHRPYYTDTGVFGRVTPHEDFHFHAPGWGAFETAARISYLDLTSGAVRGGQMLDGTLGFNWYLNGQLRLMFNYIVTSATDGPHTGVGNIVQTRVEIGL